MAKRVKKTIITGITAGEAEEAFAAYAKADAQQAKITAEIELACANGETLRITQLQAPGKKRMSAADFLRGHPLKVE